MKSQLKRQSQTQMKDFCVIIILFFKKRKLFSIIAEAAAESVDNLKQ